MFSLNFLPFNFTFAFCIQHYALNHPFGGDMKSAKQIKTFLEGSDITPEQYTNMVEIVGEEKADNMVISAKPKSPTVGFLNFFTVVNSSGQKIQKANLKFALRESGIDSLKAQAVDGWISINAVMNPNSTGNGYHCSEDFMETFQEANTRKKASKNDNGFILVPFLPMSSNNSEVPQDANSSNDAF
jgi:hypothetical protein